METVLSRHGLSGLAGDLDVDVNAMMLQPFRGQPVLMVGPLPLDLAPGCGLLRVDAQAEFAEREQALPFRGVPQRRQSVRQHSARRSRLRSNQCCMPAASVEIHFRDEIERLLRSDVGEEIIDALALFDGPLKKADDCVSALRLFRELPARGSNLRLIPPTGVLPNKDVLALPRNAFDARPRDAKP